jgi:hypothetical protein
MACSVDQYLMTSHRDINFGFAKGDFRYLEDRKVQEHHRLVLYSTEKM